MPACLPPPPQGSGLLYMDPHETQRLAQLPDGIATYFCSTIRLMPAAAIDPSLALGFYFRCARWWGAWRGVAAAVLE
jgi:hypothetical protein